MPEHNTFLEFRFLDGRCPHCLEDSTFEIWRQDFRRLIFRSVEYVIRCHLCKFEICVPKLHYPLYQRIREKYFALKKGDLSEDEFSQFVADLHLEELTELKAQSETWKCSCGDENPMNFAVCWKCGSDAPINVTPSAEKEIRLNDGHPWEM